jgi:hypothetical protein
LADSALKLRCTNAQEKSTLPSQRHLPSSAIASPALECAQSFLRPADRDYCFHLSALVATAALIRSMRERTYVRLQTAKLEQKIAKLRQEAEARETRIVMPSQEDLERYVIQGGRQEIKQGFGEAARSLPNEHYVDVIDPIRRLLIAEATNNQQSFLCRVSVGVSADRRAENKDQRRVDCR